ncbi:MAG: EamA family transporter [Kiritimatiellae bacterium]|nr:EamA family transporter [Kiritimatiellia bacterium]
MTGWTGWILASSVFLALYDLAKKASVQGNAVLPTLLCSTCFGCTAYIASLALCGHISVVSGLSTEVVALSAVKSVIVGTSWVFTFCALRTLPISIATPIRASSPALVFIVAFLLYGERPSPVQMTGMAAVFAGYFVFSWAGKYEGIDFFRNHAVWCAIAGAFCSAISSLWDKYIFQVRALPVEAVQFVFQIGLVFFYSIAFTVSRVASRGGKPFGFEWRWTIPMVGILLAAADWLYFTGLAFPDAPISAGSLLRRFSVVITFVLGAKFFHETNLVRKAIALSVILSGVVLICVG